MDMLNDNDKRPTGSFAHPRTVVPFRIVEKTPEVDEELVAFCERLLAQAKAGEINGVAVATCCAADGCANNGIGQGWNGAPGTMHTLTVAVGVLLQRMLKECGP
jgi:hypothetical protein